MTLTPSERITRTDTSLIKKMEACTKDGDILRFCASCGSEGERYKSMIDVETDKPVYLTDKEIMEVLNHVKDRLLIASHGYCNLCTEIVRDDIRKYKKKRL